MTTVTVPIAALKAVALFASRSDIRYYLQGVHVSSFRGKATLAATDGHRLTVFHDAAVPYDGVDFIIPIHLIDDFKPSKIYAMVEIVFREDDKQVGLSSGGVTAIGAAVDGKFPDWQRVIPREYSGRFSSTIKDRHFYHGANSNYMATYAKMQKLLGTRHSVITLAPNGGSTMLVDVDDARFICVLMPADSREPKLPEWYTAPHVAPEAVDTHETGDGKKFTSMTAAVEHANSVARETGSIISVVEIKPEAVSA